MPKLAGGKQPPKINIVISRDLAEEVKKTMSPGQTYGGWVVEHIRCSQRIRELEDIIALQKKLIVQLESK